ncbi:MAG: ATP-grasp domain-containing protein, partial [Candidatus Dormibacteraeota bacterium]|nr:ATP-grasp domain-containing protein [Candidatus Dormibacteraeota bacterium]
MAEVSGGRPLPPVLFLGPPRWYSALGAARSLGELGIPVFMLAHKGLSPTNVSRFCSGTVPAGDNGRPLGEPWRIVFDLCEAGCALGPGTVLIPGTDEWAVFVAEHAEELATCFRFPRAPAALVADMASKQGLMRLAGEHGFPSPRVTAPASLDEALEDAERLTYPVMVKPMVSRPDMEGKAVVHDPVELSRCARLLAESAEASNLIFQEYVPGDEDWTFTGYFDARSRCLAGFTGRRLRLSPPHMGHTTLGVCQGNAQLEAAASEFISAIGFRGIVDSEFRFDRRDGTYKLLDANPRVGGNFRVFLDVGGIDVVRALYLDQTGRPVPPVEAREGRLWVKEDSDLITF